MRNRKRRDFAGLFTVSVFLSFVLPIGYLLWRLLFTGLDGGERGREDYILMLLQCAVGVVAMTLPTLAVRRGRLELPRLMFLLYIGFLYCAIFLGEVRSFYYLVPHWDTALHAMSSAMLGALGFSVMQWLSGDERIPLTLSPAFTAVFAFCFAFTLGGIWELYEFFADALLGTNMQKFRLADGMILSGRDALADTMKDLLVDGIGALTMSIVGYISLKYKKGWVEKLVIRLRRRR